MEIYQPAEDSYLLSKILKKEISEKSHSTTPNIEQLKESPNLIKENSNLKFLEIGSGSGILLETAKKLGIKQEHIFAVDINQKAVEHCKALGFQCTYSNLFENIEGKYNLIIFNPPYLPKDEKEPVDSQLATTGGKQGSEIINKFLKQAKNYLKENGKIFLLTSSLTKGIDFKNFHKKLLGKVSLFFEELYIFELTK